MFVCISLAHLCRLVDATYVRVGGHTIPFWASWVVVSIFGYFAVIGFKLIKQK
jgi:hypothetical protein